MTMRLGSMLFTVSRRLIGAAAAAASVAALAASPELTIIVGERTVKHSVEALLANPATTTITIPQDVAYKRAMTYRAIPLATILQGVGRDDSVKFVASDGFAATIAAAPLLATADDGARAYVALEPPTARWPPLKAGSPVTAGPFYLVWLRPEKGRIAPEQWPYQVAKIEDVAPITVRFPTLVPGPNVHATDPIRRGLAVFTTNCIVCHTLNLAGDAKVGPDLNVPFSPTDYMREEFLRRQIRDPRSLRVWADGKMPGFDTSAISDRDLDDLVAYLYYMAKRKVDVPAAK
jgi:mono/diheme cytochrome c family protein